MEVSLRNAGRQPVEVQVYEHLPVGARIEAGSLPHEEMDAFTARFRVPVPAEGEAKVTFEVVR